MTKFELARTAGRWRPRSRTYVALAILYVTAWPTNADVLHDACAVRCPSIDAEGEVSSRGDHLPFAPSAPRSVLDAKVLAEGFCFPFSFLFFLSGSGANR